LLKIIKNNNNKYKMVFPHVLNVCVHWDDAE
jgi:hypothetical protein